MAPLPAIFPSLPKLRVIFVVGISTAVPFWVAMVVRVQSPAGSVGRAIDTVAGTAVAGVATAVVTGAGVAGVGLVHPAKITARITTAMTPHVMSFIPVIEG